MTSDTRFHDLTPLPAGALHVWWSRIDLLPATLAALRRDIDPETTARLGRLARVDDRRRGVVAHALLRRVCAVTLGVAPADVALQTRCVVCGGEDHGKPELAPAADAPTLEVSLTHAGSIVAVAVSRAAPVGVDLEPPHRNGWDATRRHVFRDAEWDATAREADVDVARTRTWVRKEAVAKATGHGLAVGLHNIHIAPDPTDGWRGATIAGFDLALWVADVDLPDAYEAAVATMQTVKPPVPTVLQARLDGTT